MTGAPAEYVRVPAVLSKVSLEFRPAMAAHTINALTASAPNEMNAPNRKNRFK
jgi:hypothetical protein